MLQKQSLYLQVYRSLENRIYSGVYAQGDRLSSISELAQEYGVAANTIRAALNLLCEQGLVRTDKGSGIYVLYDRSQLPEAGRFIPWLAARKDSAADLCYMHQLFMPRIVCCAAAMLNKADLEELGRIAGQYPGEEATMQEMARTLRRFALRLLAPLKNDTLTRIYTSANDYIRTPMLLDSGLGELQAEYRERFHYYLERLQKLLLAGDLPRLYRLVSRAYANMAEIFLRRANRLCAGSPSPDPQPFSFALCPEDHFRYARIANALLTDIISGEFGLDSYLPPAAALCQRYNASLVTVRRAVSMLNGYGFTRSVNGVGTQIILDSQPRESGAPLRPLMTQEAKLCAECLQILILCLYSFADLEIKRKDDGELELMYDRLTAMAARTERLGAWVVSVPLDVMIRHAKCRAMQLLYPQLTARIMLASRSNFPYEEQYREEYEQMQSWVLQAAQDIRSQDAPGFCRHLQELMITGYRLILEQLDPSCPKPNTPLPEPRLLALALK